MAKSRGIPAARRLSPIQATLPSNSVRSIYFGKTFSEPDIELQRKHDGFLMRLKAAVWIMKSEEPKRIVRDILEADISPDIVSAVLLTYTLNNPLLVKYSFNHFDFMQGARKAVIRLVKTIYSQEFASMAADPIKSTCENTRAFLQRSLSSSLYAYLMKHNAQSTQHKVVTDIKLNFTHAATVMTDVVKEDLTSWAADTKTIHALATIALRDEHVKSKLLTFNERQGETAVFNDYLNTKLQYPQGSVFASVAVVVNYELSYYEVDSKNSAGDCKPIIKTEERTRIWIFEGVISGQMELIWVVRSFGEPSGGVLP
ncbi:hypothetical protein EON65_47000 [archaeon]|nr:MAG: hypothetical protein EON65_47000 [archaeon]